MWFTYANETVRKLHTLFAEEILPKEHVCFKPFYDVISYIPTMSKGTNAEKVHWKWSEDVKEFLRAVRNIGKKRVICLLMSSMAWVKRCFSEKSKNLNKLLVFEALYP